jgi:hypothetical protein
MHPAEELNAGLMVIVVGECRRHQRTSVAEDQSRPKPSAKISSTRADVSVRVPLAEPNQAGGHAVSRKTAG